MAGDFMQGDTDHAVAVPFSDDETGNKAEDLAEDEDSPSATAEERITRKQKRAERIKRLLDEGKQSKDELTQLRSEQSSLREELAELRGRLSAQPAPQGVPSKDRYEAALDEVYEKQTEAYNAAQAEIKAGTWNADRQRHYEKIARDVETAKSRIHTQRELDSRQHSTRAEQAQQVWAHKYPEVYGDARAYQYAEATFRRRQALLGRNEPVTNELIEEVMAETMTTLKLGKRSTAPTASDKSRLSGISASGNGGGGRGGDSGVQMTPQLRRMAIAAYSDLPEAEAVKKWVNKEGKSLRAKKLL
jgi:hypothetical protein